MTALLVLFALVGLVFGLVNLVRPTGRLGISSRTAAGWLTAGAVVVLLIASSLPPSTGEDPEAAATTTTAGLAETATTTRPSPPTTVGMAPSTSLASSTTVASTEDPDDPGTPNHEGPAGPTAEVATVAGITDGDTLDVVLEDGSRDTVRLIGINAPESGECWASEAARALEDLAPSGTEIAMTRDRSNRDRFDRLLRYLWVGSTSLNEELVRVGAAISRRYPPDTAMAHVLDSAQTEAESAEAGMWAPDACGPASDANLQVVELRYDAEGNDNHNLNDEWIVIGNEGEEPVELTGWGIKDESATNRYRFPDGLTMAPGATIIVYSGCGEDSRSGLYWCSVGSAVWNNDGDTAFLLDPEGNTHYSFTYSP